MSLSRRDFIRSAAAGSAALACGGAVAALMSGSCGPSGQLSGVAGHPNIVLILADDMGYGDVQAFNQASTIPTPNLNRLTAEGVQFTDAHTPSGICTPTRYGLLTGRYCWRTRLKRGVLKGYDAPLIEEKRVTIAEYLQGIGYRTGVIGKWHLGLEYHKKETAGDAPAPAVDLTKPLQGTPNNHGFDYSFVLPASLDFEPYIYVRNDRVVDTEFESAEDSTFPYFWRKGVKSKSLEFDRVLDDLLIEAKEFITRESTSEKPFFLYFPMTAPHTPVVPTEKFLGTSGKGMYGDFINQIDWTAGEILNLLEKLNLKDDTLVIFTSDNGSNMRLTDSSTEPDHVIDETLQCYNPDNHQANGLLRGRKGDVWEGGHRVPFTVRWPSGISGKRKIHEPICLTDIFETIVDITGGRIPEGQAEDSYSFSQLLSGEKQHLNRPPIIHHSGGKGTFAIREGTWKLILGNGSGARTKPVGTPFGKPYQLYNLLADIVESNNLIVQEAEIAERLTQAFFKIKGNS